MCPVLTGRSRGPADLDVFRGLKPVSGAFPGRLGRRVRMTILCNSPLPAALPRPWRQKKEAPLPARIQIIIACQTRQDLNRMLEKPIPKWTGCPRTPLEPTTGERHAQNYPCIRVMHRWRWVHFIIGLVGYSMFELNTTAARGVFSWLDRVYHAGEFLGTCLCG
jgi:hypothetical protein